MATPRDEFRPDSTLVAIVISQTVQPRLASFESDGAPTLVPAVVIAVRDDLFPFGICSSTRMETDATTSNGELRLRFRQTGNADRILWRIESLFPDVMPSTGFVGFNSRGDARRDGDSWDVRANGWTGKYNVRDWYGWS